MSKNRWYFENFSNRGQNEDVQADAENNNENDVNSEANVKDKNINIAKVSINNSGNSN